MNRTKLPIRKRLGDVPQFSRSIDAAVAEEINQYKKGKQLLEQTKHGRKDKEMKAKPVGNIGSSIQQLKVLYPQICSTKQRPVPQFSKKTYAIFFVKVKVNRLWEEGEWHGQAQKWFLMRLMKDESEINLASGEVDPEFSEWKWANTGDVIEQAVDYKRPTYEEVMKNCRVGTLPGLNPPKSSTLMATGYRWNVSP
ncbi:hypothetical protein AgCh_005562 [Apium graveolens]